MDSAGYVERIAIDLSNTAYSVRDLYLSEDPISNDFMLGRFDLGAPASRSSTFGSWYLITAPESGTLTLLALGLFAIRKR